MKLKFKRAVAAGTTMYAAGNEYEIADVHAAEVYVAHGYATAAGGAKVGKETLGEAGPKQEAPSANIQGPKA